MRRNAGRFEKGHKPWNDGTKGQGLTGANSGSFTPGNIPPNRKPVGSERINEDYGYVMIKVAEVDPYTGSSTRYRPKHVVIWETHHDQHVPKGMVVIFADSGKRNFDPANLQLVSRAELVRLNQNHFGNAPAELKPTIIALSKLQTKAGALRRASREDT